MLDTVHVFQRLGCERVSCAALVVRHVLKCKFASANVMQEHSYTVLAGTVAAEHFFDTVL